MSVGDIISQTAIEKSHISGTYEPLRTLRFLGFGIIFAGPTLRLWYKTLDKIVPSTLAFKPVRMMALDQLVFAPCFLTIFCMTMGVLKGENWTALTSGLKETLPSIILSNYKLWPAAQLFNFYLVPLQHRVLFANTISLGWNTYMSWKVGGTKKYASNNTYAKTET
ncbi:protein Mpv17-like isoform X2 [Watersipora subatra]